MPTPISTFVLHTRIRVVLGEALDRLVGRSSLSYSKAGSGAPIEDGLSDGGVACGSFNQIVPYIRARRLLRKKAFKFWVFPRRRAAEERGA